MLALTSALDGEGKSTLAATIAVTTARDHAADVLLIECDLMRPSIGADFGIEHATGLVDVLQGAGTVEEAAQHTGMTNLYLLPAGGAVDNPSRLLRSQSMDDLLRAARARFAFVVLDLPAVLASSDAAVLAGQADGTVLVVRAGRTDQRRVRQAVDLLSSVTMHGVVLNRWRSNVPDMIRRLVEW